MSKPDLPILRPRPAPVPDDGLRETIRQIRDEVEASYRELHGENARAAVILAVAGLENELERLILKHFPTLDHDLHVRLFETARGPFGDLSSRADVAQAFGHFGSVTRKKIKDCATIRNAFAHAHRAITFQQDDVFKRCIALEIGDLLPGGLKPDNDLLKDRFIDLVQDLVLKLERHSEYLPGLGEQEPLPLP